MNKMSKYSPRGMYPGMFGKMFDDDFFNFNERNLPAVNVKENAREFKLEVSAPGFDKEDFNIEVNKNVLTISAESRSENEMPASQRASEDVTMGDGLDVKVDSYPEPQQPDKLLRREFSYSSFSRSFTLPENIDTDNITAKGKNGVLHISLPKREDADENTVKSIRIE